MDFRENPVGRPEWGGWNRRSISETALEYLENSEAWAESPIERLKKLNPDSIELYRKFGIKLESEALEVDICAQHNNGGLSADIWWESTNIRRLFPVGEINGTHGISRPGGSALNSGQVGALRAAERIVSYRGKDDLNSAAILPAIRDSLESTLDFICEVTSPEVDGTQSPEDYRLEYRRRMSLCGGMVRDPHEIKNSLAAAENQLNESGLQRCGRREQLPLVLKNRHMVLAHFCYLSAIDNYLENGGGSRGSCIVLSAEGKEIHKLLDSRWKLEAENREKRKVIQTVRLKAGKWICEDRSCRKIPANSYWFEKVWSDFKSNTHVKESKEC